MGNLSQGFNFKCMFTTLFFLFLLSHTASSHSSNQEIQPQDPSSTPLANYHQVFYLKNTDPMFLSRQKRRMNRNKNMKHRKKKKKKMVKNKPQSRPFSVMLPKGFVPPSGSSPCHNDQPNSVTSFHCHLTTTQP